MSRNITPEEFQLVYELVFPLHPREDVALRVTMDACDYLRELERNQARRTRSERHWKADMTREQLLQYAAYTVSYYRELDQESPRPLLTPFYKPTREDRIVRYVKHILFRTYLLNSRSLAIGIGCLLYGYKPSEIADLLFLFEERSLRTVKMRLTEDLRKRFVNDDVVSPDGKSIRTIPASDNDRLIVEGALKAFTPWGTDHLEPPTHGRLMLDILSDEENPLSEWQRKHALIDPECVGLNRLINEFNKYVSSNPIFKRLADPRGNLMVPDFGGGPQPSLDRFRRRLLSDSDKMMLNERRKPSGPWAYLAEMFWFISELVPLEDYLIDWPSPMNFWYEDELTTIPDHARHENHDEAWNAYGPFCSEFRRLYGRPTRIDDTPAFTRECRVVLLAACEGPREALLPTLLPAPLITFPLPQHTARPLYSTPPPSTVFWYHLLTEGEQVSESESPRLFDVFEESYFLPGRPRNTVSQPDFAFDVDIGSTVDPRRSFANENQAYSKYPKTLVFDVIWSSETSATIHASLLDLNQLLLLLRYQAGESTLGHDFFHFGGHGFKLSREPSCLIASHYGEQSFLSNEIDGSICVWEAKRKRSQSQCQQPAHDVLEMNAEMALPKHCVKAGTPFIDQSKPTRSFTFQGL